MHRFSWDGISFEVPAHWNLSAHHRYKGVSNVSMEDDTALRLQIEWTRARAPLDADTVRRRYGKQSRKLADAAEATAAIGDLPQAWTAFQYSMPGKRALVVAYFFQPENGLFCFLRMHLDPAAPSNPKRLMQTIASSFRYYESGLIPWEFYDVSFKLDSAFQLAGASLQAGMKLMTFEWRLRRLFVWHFSLADMILKKTSIQEWTVNFLNGAKTLRGPVFAAEDNGKIKSRRARMYPFGHYEEIGRQCFRYNVGYRRLAERNQIAVWVFNYRREADLEKLAIHFSDQV